MMEPIDLEDFKNEVEFLEGCCLAHPSEYAEQDFITKIVQVEAWIQSENEGPSGFALFRLDDGKWATLEESQDYTGHGICHSEVNVFTSRDDAIRLGLGEERCSRLEIPWVEPQV